MDLSLTLLIKTKHVILAVGPFENDSVTKAGQRVSQLPLLFVRFHAYLFKGCVISLDHPQRIRRRCGYRSGQRLFEPYQFADCEVGWTMNAIMKWVQMVLANAANPARHVAGD